MRIGKPSPAMIVALIALVMAMSGSAVAAIDYARNAGAVDGKSAVGAGALLKDAKGKLVATASGGPTAGRIPGKFLTDVMRGNGQTSTFGAAIEVTDNATGAPFDIALLPDIGKVTATCADQAGAAGREDPESTITFINSSGTGVNYSRATGTGTVEVVPVAPGTVAQFTIGGSNTFTVHVESARRNFIVQGTVRQDGRSTPAASCLMYGAVLRVG